MKLYVLKKGEQYWDGSEWVDKQREALTETSGEKIRDAFIDLPAETAMKDVRVVSIVPRKGDRKTLVSEGMVIGEPEELPSDEEMPPTETTEALQRKIFGGPSTEN